MGGTVSLNGLFYGLRHLFCFLRNLLFSADEICDLFQIIQNNNRKHVGRNQVTVTAGVIAWTEAGPDQADAGFYLRTFSIAGKRIGVGAVFTDEAVRGFLLVIHFGLKYSQDFVNTFPENLVKLIRSSGVLPEQIGELQRIAERIDLILSLPDPRSHIGLVLLPAVAVRSFVECVCVWIDVDAHKLAADEACDQVSQLRVILCRHQVRAQLCYRVTQPHGRDISGDDVGAAVLHFLYGCVEGIGVASLKHINDFRLVFQFFSQA